MAEFAPYETTRSLVRDLLWRCWLGVECQIQTRWVAAAAHGESNPAEQTHDEIAGVLSAALGEFSDPSSGGVSDDFVVQAEYRRHAALTEARIAATAAAGIRLPYLELRRRFALTAAQRLVLDYAVMPEIDPKLVVAYRHLVGDPTCRGLDARLLAMLVYDRADRRADLSRDLSATSPLVAYRLIELDETTGGYDSALFRRLRPAARLVQLLAGATVEPDPELHELAELRSGDAMARFPEPLVARAAAALRSPDALLVVRGVRGAGKRLLLQVAAHRIGRKILLIRGAALAALPPAQVRPALRSIVRECHLLDAVPALPDLDDAVAEPGERGDLLVYVRQLAAEHRGAMAITLGADRMPRLDFRPLVQVALGVPAFDDRAALWRHWAPGLPAADTEALASRFVTSGGVIALAVRAASAERAAANDPPDLAAFDRAVRSQLDDRLARLGRRIDRRVGFDDLVIEDNTLASLCEIIAALRERRKVRERWGFRGAAGISVLFSGDPGVGKTMSATVIARQLGLAIYEIDLSRVVSRWMGETERNLGEVFDAAEPGHAVLLFDEADSLFGKRAADVKSSNDRRARMETDYLLQRLERFGGLAILTTNLHSAVDPAFRRRFAYDVQFTFPDPAMRTELWRRAIPRAAEVGDIDFEELGARFELSGGFIKVAAERSAFQAAALREPISTRAVVVTVHRMYRERGNLSAMGRLE